MTVRLSQLGDVDSIVTRVQQRLARDARVNPLLNPSFSEEVFSDTLGYALDQTWVDVKNNVIVGHLYGALLASAEYDNGVWIGPDGVSFDNADVLTDLYTEAAATWISQGATEHYVWVLDTPDDTAPWYELGFARMHVRGGLVLSGPRHHTLAPGYVLRRGGLDDLAIAIELDRVLDEAQQQGPSFALFVDHVSRPEELLEALEDDEVHHYVVEYFGEGVAQCLTFPLEARRGSFDKTLHVSAVAVRPEHEHRGVATALIDLALNEAIEAGFRFVETNWRVTNHRAGKFWRRYGFSPTYVRLHRTIGAG
ncbi:MAG TPA: GNAT family N-acetyltransferase [Acidimicrobiales bacterium]